MRKVMAGTKLPKALAAEDEARYNPSKYTFWFTVTLHANPTIINIHQLHTSFFTQIHILKLIVVEETF